MYKVCPQCSRRFDTSGPSQCPEDGAPLLRIRRSKDPMVGRTLNERFTIIERLGRGGFGTVYRAVQHPVERSVAVKVLKTEHAESELQVKRFFNEARSISKLRNNHTIKLYDFGQTDEGQLYMAMELAPGRSLNEVRHDTGRITPRRAAEIMAQVCDSLAEAHANGVVHRDLKPDNIMIEEDPDKGDVVKVLDFGVAKVANDTTTITQAGTLQGTPSYMSPEQAMAKKVSPASDLYSVGVMLYELLSGKNPFRADTAIATVMAQVNRKPPRLGELIPDLSDGYEQLVMELLRKKPSRRPKDAARVRDRLRDQVDTCTDVVLGTTQVRLLDDADSSTPLNTSPFSQEEVNPVGEPRRSTWPLLVGVVALAGAAVWIFGPPRSRDDAARETPEPAAAVAAREPVERESEPERPAQPELVAVSPSRVVRPPEVDTAPRADRRSATAWAAVEPWTVSLSVVGTTGATVLVDGERVGEVPIETAVPYGHDPVLVRVRMAGHRPETRSIVPTEDVVATIDLRKRRTRPKRSDLMPLTP